MRGGTAQRKHRIYWPFTSCSALLNTVTASARPARALYKANDKPPQASGCGCGLAATMVCRELFNGSISKWKNQGKIGPNRGLKDILVVLQYLRRIRQQRRMPGFSKPLDAAQSDRLSTLEVSEMLSNLPLCHISCIVKGLASRKMTCCRWNEHAPHYDLFVLLNTVRRPAHRTSSCPNR